MRFFWLTLAIITPLIAVSPIDDAASETIQMTYFVVASIFEILSISFTISEFLKFQKRERDEEIKRIKRERDEDISKWRKEYLDEVVRIKYAQKEMEKENRG